ncbi:MAG TPA: SDR family oxidoreductase [Smithellaceae bacterium]|nr:SDR family oxidoreductase [Smithellaceae bacterium]
MRDFMLNPVIPRRIKNDELVISKRQQIALAAIKLFSEKGFHQTGLRELAEKAGLALGNIYDYVGSKQDILFLIHGYIYGVGMEKANSVLTSVDDPLEKLYRLIKAEIDLMYECSDAVLLLYRESKILDKPRLKELLKNEKRRVTIIEDVLRECMDERLIKEVNARAAANFIKGMAETLVAKRWDISGFVSRAEIESTMLRIVFDGLRQEKSADTCLAAAPSDDLRGKTALIVNVGTNWGRDLPSFLLDRGVKLFLHRGKNLKSRPDDGAVVPEEWRKAQVFLAKKSGHLRIEHLKQAEKNLGGVSFLVQDFGAVLADSGYPGSDRQGSILRALREHLDFAAAVAGYLQSTMNKAAMERIVFLAPWAWDKQTNPVWFETVKAAAIEFTKTLAKELASVHVNVNCIIPGFIGGEAQAQTAAAAETLIPGEIPLGYIGKNSDVWETIYFLLSGKSRYLTGQILHVSGGSC